MTFPVQGTDVGIQIHPPISGQQNSGRDDQGTSDAWGRPPLGTDGFFFIEPTTDLDLSEEARFIVHSFENRDISARANHFLTIFRSMLRTQVDTSYLPSLSAFSVDDGSLLIEWIFEHFRVGFSFEPDHDESSWYIVSDATLGRISAGGYLSGMNIEQLLHWIINSANHLLMS